MEKSTFAGRIELLREMAYRLRDIGQMGAARQFAPELRQAAETLLTEVQHMEAAADRFKQRVSARKERQPQR